MSGTNPVRETTLRVVQKAESVSINRQAIEKVADQWSAGHLRIPLWPKALHLDSGDERKMLDYLILLDSLNFCFWHSRKPRWEIWHEDNRYNGYFALSLALKRFFEKLPEKANLRNFSRISFEEFLRVLQGGQNLLFLSERWKIARRVSEYITRRYGNSRSFIRSGNGRLSMLVPKIASELYSFNDSTFYEGQRVYLWKRAQILAIDIRGALEGRGAGHFTDLHYATAFADYKLPQILAHLGILEYSPELRSRIEDRMPIQSRSKEEIEIRSATIWAVEYLKEALARRGRELYSFEIDWILWDMSQKETMAIPYHLTQTVFY